MSRRFLIVRRTNPRRGIYKNRDVLELPDAEHVHLTRQPDGTYTAVPMKRVIDLVPGELPEPDWFWVNVPVEDR